MTIQQIITTLCARPDGATQAELALELGNAGYHFPAEGLKSRVKTLVRNGVLVKRGAMPNADDVRSVFFLTEEQASKSSRADNEGIGWFAIYTRRVVKLLEDRPGLTREEISEETGIFKSYIGEIVCKARADGLLFYVQLHGSIPKWYSLSERSHMGDMPICTDAVMQQAATSEGVTSLDGSHSIHRNRKRLERDVAHGFLVRAPGVERGKNITRYFTRQELADAYTVRNQAQVAELAKERKVERAKKDVVRYQKASRAAKPGIELVRRNPKPAQPGTKAETQHPRGEVIIPAGLQITRCPSPTFDKRYQIDPNQRVQGGFATAGIGRYLEAA